jgi:hypothetical protein
MNHRITSIGLALLISLAGSACASTIDLDRQAVEIVATPEARLAAQAVLADPYGEYQYAMSNGRRLSVTTSGQTLIVRYGRRVPTLLQHDGQGRFVSGDGRFVLRFGLDDEGQPYAVSLSLPAALA